MAKGFSSEKKSVKKGFNYENVRTKIMRGQTI